MHASQRKHRNEIATLNGIDFTRLVDKGNEKEAVAIVDELIGKNRDEFPWIIEKEECSDQGKQVLLCALQRYTKSQYRLIKFNVVPQINAVPHGCSYLSQ